MSEVGVNDVMAAAGQAQQIPGACPYCSGPHTAVIHGDGVCPRVAEIEFYDNGRVKRVRFHDDR